MSLAATGRLFLLYNGTQFVHKSVITGHKSEAVCDIEMRPSCMFRGWGGGKCSYYKYLEKQSRVWTRSVDRESLFQFQDKNRDPVIPKCSGNKLILINWTNFPSIIITCAVDNEYSALVGGKERFPVPPPPKKVDVFERNFPTADPDQMFLN